MHLFARNHTPQVIVDLQPRSLRILGSCRKFFPLQDPGRLGSGWGVLLAIAPCGMSTQIPGSRGSASLENSLLSSSNSSSIDLWPLLVKGSLHRKKPVNEVTPRDCVCPTLCVEDEGEFE